MPYSYKEYTVYSWGEEGSSMEKVSVQSYKRIHETHRAKGELFIDPEFKPNENSLFSSSEGLFKMEFVWLRPYQITKNPEFLINGPSRFDVRQGELGNCWMSAAIANLTMHSVLFKLVVPENQDFHNYAGVFHFRFWYFGSWIDVVVDDFLPTYNGKLMFLHSAHENEFWSALLEKAYAKVNGNYQNLQGGSASEAMEDFSGGLSETYILSKSPSNLQEIILKAYEHLSLMTSAIEGDPVIKVLRTPEGLIKGHSYSISRVHFLKDEKILLLRIRNPWGNQGDWNGAWSDQSDEWAHLPEAKKIDLSFAEGEFWMSLDDFKKYFGRLEICNVNPPGLDGKYKSWEMTKRKGAWIPELSAGGCRNIIKTFHKNPQYFMNLKMPDKNETKCSVIISLMQTGRKMINDTPNLTIGFLIYNMKNPDKLPKPLDMNFFKYNSSVAKTDPFSDTRSVSCHCQLPTGSYVIVPSTFEPNLYGEFTIRVFSESKIELGEWDVEVAYINIDPLLVNAIHVPSSDSPEEVGKMKEIMKFFKKFAGEGNKLDWVDLKKLLDYIKKKHGDDFLPHQKLKKKEKKRISESSDGEVDEKGVSKEICRSMIAMMDKHSNGKLNFDEFMNLWIEIKRWKVQGNN